MVTADQTCARCGGTFDADAAVAYLPDGPVHGRPDECACVFRATLAALEETCRALQTERDDLLIRLAVAEVRNQILRAEAARDGAADSEPQQRLDRQRSSDRRDAADTEPQPLLDPYLLLDRQRSRDIGRQIEAGGDGRSYN